MGETSTTEGICTITATAQPQTNSVGLIINSSGVLSDTFARKFRGNFVNVFYVIMRIARAAAS